MKMVPSKSGKRSQTMSTLTMAQVFDLPEKITIFLVVDSFSVEGRLSAFCGGGVMALGAMAVRG
jgi:hypothetical protein